ncbi:MAG: AI-2E family transporter [Epsilonproteobacteria bacterium]|nr:AI-2E family transporter [Campylobacterota bacterium]
MDIFKFWIGLAAFIIIVAGIKLATTLLVPILLSIFIASVAAPLVSWLEEIGFNRAIAFLVVLLIVVLILSGFGYIILSSADEFVNNIPLYTQRIDILLESLKNVLKDFGINLDIKEIKTLLDLENILGVLGELLKALSKILSKSLLIFLGVMFILVDIPNLKAKLRVITQNKDSSNNPFETFSYKVNKYLFLKTLISLATGLSIGIGLYFLGVDFAPLLGLIAFLLNYIPAIGSIIAAIPAIIVSLAGADPMVTIWVIVLYLAVNMLFGNILEPKVMGDGLGLSVLVVFLSLLFWGWVFGAVGMFLAVPLTMTIKLALEQHPKTKLFAFMLGSYKSKK